jgi:hypothetical protein
MFTKIKFTHNDRQYKIGQVIECGNGCAKEFVKRGVAIRLQPEPAAQKKGK